MFGLYGTDKSQLKDTMNGIEKILLDQSPIGGSPRYERDQYFVSKPAYQGNPWSVTTLWLAQYYIQCKQPEKAIPLVKWALDRALPSGVMSEQVNPTDGTPVSVTPLVWSHAELINTVLDLSKIG